MLVIYFPALENPLQQEQFLYFYILCNPKCLEMVVLAPWVFNKYLLT